MQEDVALLASSRIGSQKLLETLEQCVYDLGLMVNNNKSAFFKFMINKRLQHSLGKVFMFVSPIRRVSEYKYLRVLLSENITLEADIARMSRALLKQLNSFYSKFYYLSGYMLNYLLRT